MQELHSGGIVLLCLRTLFLAGSINDPARQKPEKGGVRQKLPECPEHGQADPAHRDIKRGREPFRTADPAGLDDDTGQGDAPYCRQKKKSDGKIDAVGTHEQLLSENRIYQEIYYSQQEGRQL